MIPSTHGEGLRIARLLMVLSSMSPLFLLWALRGNEFIADRYFVPACIFMVVLPNLALILRKRAARKNRELRTLTIGVAEDHRDHVLVYLFALLLPFYTVPLGTWRDISATAAAIVFIVFLFWHLNLHYMNILFALQGFRVFTVQPPIDNNSLSGRERFVVITRRPALSPGQTLSAYRLSDTIYFEEAE